MANIYIVGKKRKIILQKKIDYKKKQKKKTKAACKVRSIHYSTQK